MAKNKSNLERAVEEGLVGGAFGAAIGTVALPGLETAAGAVIGALVVRGMDKQIRKNSKNSR